MLPLAIDVAWVGVSAAADDEDDRLAARGLRTLRELCERYPEARPMVRSELAGSWRRLSMSIGRPLVGPRGPTGRFDLGAVRS